MLTLIVGRQEHFDEEKSEFLFLGGVELSFEHSLVSLSKWESKFQKPFLTPGNKTNEDTLAYIRFMLLTEDVPDEVLMRMTQKDLDAINDYIESSQSATTFGVLPEKKSTGDVITSELIYFWMVNYNIPFEVENWHLNRLFSLIRICNVKNSKPKKLSPHEIAQRNRDLNAKRKAELQTSG